MSLGKSLWLCVNISFQCNRRCDFCYNKDVLEHSDIMSDACLDRIADRVRRHIDLHGMPKHLSYCIIGGEPTMFPEKIKHLVEGINTDVPGARAFIDTNGDFLSEDLCSWCKKWNVEIQLSANDTPINIIEQYLDFLKRTGVGIRPFVVLSEDNLYRLKDLFSLYWRYTDRVIIRQQLGRVDDDYVDLYGKKVSEAIKFLLDNDMIFDPENMFEVLSVKSTTFKYGCGTRICVIDPDGSARWCLESPTERDTVIGNIWDEDFDFLTALKYSTHPIRKPELASKECLTCEFAHMCGGGCPKQRLRKYGTIDGTKSILCSAIKEILPLMIEMRKRYYGE